MTDRDRYLILLNSTVRARYDLIHGNADDARVALARGVQLVKRGTSDAHFNTDCAESEDAVEAGVSEVVGRAGL